MVRWTRCFGLALSGLLLVPPVLAQTTAPLQIGSETVQFPLSEGNVSVSGRAPSVFELLGKALPPGIRLVETYYTEADLKRTLLGISRPQDTYCAVQTLRDMESLTVSQAEWEQGKLEMARQLGDLDPVALGKKLGRETSARLSEASGAKVELNMEKLSRPVVYSTEGNAIRFIMQLPLTGKVGSSDVDERLVMVGAMVRVRSKLMQVFLYHIRQDEKTSTQLQTDLEDLLSRLEAANQGNPAAANPASAGAQAPADTSHAVPETAVGR